MRNYDDGNILALGIAQSVWRLARTSTVQGSKTGGGVRDFPHPSTPALGPIQPRLE